MKLVMLLVCAALLTGCTSFTFSRYDASSRNDEFKFRECTLETWSIVIADGYRIKNCRDRYIKVPGARH